MFPRDPGQVQVFQTEKPSRPYAEVATIETQGQSGAVSPETIMEKLREEFDFIIIDSHPVLPATDSLLIGQQVDAVILSVLREVSQMRVMRSRARSRKMPPAFQRFHR